MEPFEIHDGYQLGFGEAHVTQTALAEVSGGIGQTSILSATSDTTLTNTISSIRILVLREIS